MRLVDLILIKEGLVTNVAVFDADGFMPLQPEDPVWGQYVERTELTAYVATGWAAKQDAEGGWTFTPPET